ncbi:hypothetical protein GCM10022403_079420 [Streptomyces coacervatus]|uniref:Uncharacterized protein n=1 Tax=Streptomyces coacervatus TaxID=647381 RepID=A0ABP7J694_9ACTN
MNPFPSEWATDLQRAPSRTASPRSAPTHGAHGYDAALNSSATAQICERNLIVPVIAAARGFRLEEGDWTAGTGSGAASPPGPRAALTLTPRKPVERSLPLAELTHEPPNG